MEHTLILITGIVGVVFILVSVYAAIVAASDYDDRQRLQRLRDEGAKKFPGLSDYEMLRWLRSDRFNKIKWHSNNNQSIAELAEDYLVLNDEIQRIEQEEQQFGGEFMPYAERKDTLV